jgi:hypothetical protein
MSTINLTGGRVTLRNGAANYGTINADVTIAATSSNNGTITGSVTVTANGSLGGTVNGNADVTDGTVLQNTVVNGDLTMRGGSTGGGATVGGNLTLNNTASISSSTVTGNVVLNDTTSVTSTAVAGNATINGGTLASTSTVTGDIVVNSGTNEASAAGNILVAPGATNTGTILEGGTGTVQTGIASGSPTITLQPIATTASAGAATFTVTVDNASGFQWQVKGTSDADFSDISGETSSTLSLTGLGSGDDGKKYRCVVTNNNGTVYSRFATLSNSASAKNGYYSDGYYVSDVLSGSGETATPVQAQDDSKWYTYDNAGAATIANNNYSNYAFVDGEIQTSFSSTGGLLELCYPIEAVDNLGYYYEYNSGAASLASGLYVNAAYAGGQVNTTVNYTTPQKIKWSGGDAYYTYSDGIASAAGGLYSNGAYSGGSFNSSYTTVSVNDFTQCVATVCEDGNYYEFSSGVASLASGLFYNGAFSDGGLNGDHYSLLGTPEQIKWEGGFGYAVYAVYAGGLATPASGAYTIGYFQDGLIKTDYNTSVSTGSPEVALDDAFRYYYYTSGVSAPAGGAYTIGYLTDGYIDSSYNNDTPQQPYDSSTYYVYSAGVAAKANGYYYVSGYWVEGESTVAPSGLPTLTRDGGSGYYVFSTTTAGAGASSYANGYYSNGYYVNGTLTNGAGSVEQSIDEVDTYRFYSTGGDYSKANGYYMQGYYSNGAQSVAPDNKPHQANDSVLFYTYSTDYFGPGNVANGFWTSGYYSSGAITPVTEGYYQADDNNYYFYNSDGSIGAQAPAAGTPAGTAPIYEGQSGYNYVVGAEHLEADGMGGTRSALTYDYIGHGTELGSDGLGGTLTVSAGDGTHNITYGGNWFSDGTGGAYSEMDYPTGVIYTEYGSAVVTTPVGDARYDIQYIGDGTGGYSAVYQWPGSGVTINQGTNSTNGGYTITTPAGDVNFTQNYDSDGNGGYSPGADGRPASGTLLNSGTGTIHISETNEDVPYTINYNYDGNGGYNTDPRYPAQGTLLSASNNSVSVTNPDTSAEVATYSYDTVARADGGSESYTVSNEYGVYTYGHLIASDDTYNYYADGAGSFYTQPV